MIWLIGAGLAYFLTKNTDTTTLTDKSPDYVPSSIINANKSNSLRDKHPDPLRFGQSASTVNNKFDAPSDKVRGLVAMRQPSQTGAPAWPMNEEAFKIAEKRNQAMHEGPVDFWYGVGILKNPLFTGNANRFGPNWKLKADISPPSFNEDIPKAVNKANHLNKPEKTY